MIKNDVREKKNFLRFSFSFLSSKNITGDHKAVNVLMLDSTYRNNECNRIQDLQQNDGFKLDTEINALTVKLNNTKNKKKKELLQIEINECEMKNKLHKENLKIEFLKLIPDGYIILECDTLIVFNELYVEEIIVPEKDETFGGRFIPKYAKKPRKISVQENKKTKKEFVVVTLLRPKILNSIYESDKNTEKEYFSIDIYNNRPSPSDFIQSPLWFTQFQRIIPGSYFEDEIFLGMRQNQKARSALVIIEDKGFLPYVQGLYEHSPLRDFSKDRAEREVDIERPGEILFLFNFFYR